MLQKNHQCAGNHSLLKMYLVSSMLLLTGCVSMSGIFPQAKMTAPEQLKTGQAISTAETISWPHESWWQAYHDAQLDSLLAKAIKDSPTLHAAQSRIALSQAYAESMHAETKPNISAEASAVRERFTELQFIPPPWGGQFDWNNKATLSLAYDLDLWGRQESIWKASVGESRAVAAEAQQVKLGLETAIVRSYVQLALEFSLRDIAEEQLHELEQLVSISRRSYNAGLSTQMEVLEAETPLPSARARLEAVDARIKLLRNQLAALAGEGPGAGETITRPTMALDASVGLPDKLPANLVGRRPDVLAQRWRVEAAQSNIEGAKAAFYPNINLIAFVGFQALGFGQLISNAAAIAGAGPAISLPIFDGGRRRGNLSAKTASYDIAVDNYNEVLVKALQDVSDQLVVLQSNEKQMKEAQLAKETALKAHELAKVSFKAGLSNYLHVLVTHETVLRQREAIANLQAVKLDRYAGLMRSLGGGTIEQPIEQPVEQPMQQPVTKAESAH